MSAPQTSHDCGSPWAPMETAPKDGRKFWGKVGDDAIAMFWHPNFDEFISSFRRMTMAPGYLINGQPYEDHSPEIHRPTGWMTMPGDTAQEIGGLTPPPIASDLPSTAAELKGD